MQTECDRINDELYRAVHGDAWHGPPLRALLTDVTPEMAASHPIHGAHSIWELVIHMTVWADIARRRVEGEVVEPTPTEDWPPVPSASQAAWTDAVAKLDQAYSDLRRVALTVGDGHLDDRAPAKPDSLYVLLHGVAQHAAYHGGQVAMLKRAAQGTT
jgi:uncharacterized damage-inducible protein DinB